jgi:hypothetical protein
MCVKQGNSTTRERVNEVGVASVCKQMIAVVLMRRSCTHIKRQKILRNRSNFIIIVSTLLACDVHTRRMTEREREREIKR